MRSTIIGIAAAIGMVCAVWSPPSVDAASLVRLPFDSGTYLVTNGYGNGHHANTPGEQFGLDLRADSWGTPDSLWSAVVRAPASGTVTWVSNDCKTLGVSGPTGSSIAIELDSVTGPDGQRAYVMVCHVAGPRVSIGNRVVQGQTDLGRVFDSGSSSHIHIHIFYSKDANPPRTSVPFDGSFTLEGNPALGPNADWSGASLSASSTSRMETQPVPASGWRGLLNQFTNVVSIFKTVAGKLLKYIVGAPAWASEFDADTLRPGDAVLVVTGGSAATSGPQITPTTTPVPATPIPRPVATPVATVPCTPGIAVPSYGATFASGQPVTFVVSLSGCTQLQIWIRGGQYGDGGVFSGWQGGAAFTYAQGLWPGSMQVSVQGRASNGAISDWSSSVSFTVGTPAGTVIGAPAGVQGPPYPPTFVGHTVSYGGHNFRSDDGRTWVYQHPDNNVVCAPGTDGVMLYRDGDFSTRGGCLFTTSDIPDLTPYTYARGVSGIQFLGSYVGRYQVFVYRQANYQDLCGSYWQGQSDLRNCAGQAMSIQIQPYSPPVPIPVPTGTTLVGNIALLASLPSDARAAVDGSLGTQWIGGHAFRLTLTWSQPATIHRVVVWDRSQSDSDNNQINMLQLRFSDGSVIAPMDMTSGGPRCIDVTFSSKTITSMTIEPVDQSGNNGLREVEVWATTGQQYSNSTCVMKINR